MEHKGGHWQVHEEYIVHTVYYGMLKGTSWVEAMLNGEKTRSILSHD